MKKKGVSVRAFRCVGGRLLVNVVVDVDNDGKRVPNAHDVIEPSILWPALANFHNINHGI